MCGLKHRYAVPKTAHPLGRLQRLLRNTRDRTPKAHTIEDDDTRPEPPAASLPLGDAVRAAKRRERGSDGLQPEPEPEAALSAGAAASAAGAAGAAGFGSAAGSAGAVVVVFGAAVVVLPAAVLVDDG